MGKDKPNIELWDKAVENYSIHLQKGKNDLVMIYQPAIDELLGDVCRKRILDAGCGEGYYCRKLSSQGAFVTGIDGSKKMIAHARSKNPKAEVNYQVMDLTQRLDFKEAQFDIVLANMVLMDIPRIDVTIVEFARILKKDGSLVLSIVHPCFFCYGWISDEKGAKICKPISDYLNEKVEELTFWGKTLHYHRPLSYYFSLLEGNEFCVVSFKEPIPSDQLLWKHPDWKYHTRIPSFIVLKAIFRGKKSA